MLVPDLRNKRLDEGFAALRSRGLCVAFSEVPLASNLVAVIDSQEPPGGTRVHPDTAVRLDLGAVPGLPYATPGRKVVPRVVGSSLAVAVGRLQGAGLNYWRAKSVTLTPSRAPSVAEALEVTSQAPRPGARFRQVRLVPRGAHIDAVEVELRPAESAACSTSAS